MGWHYNRVAFLSSDPGYCWPLFEVLSCEIYDLTCTKKDMTTKIATKATTQLDHPSNSITVKHLVSDFRCQITARLDNSPEWDRQVSVSG